MDLPATSKRGVRGRWASIRLAPSLGALVALAATLVLASPPTASAITTGSISGKVTSASGGGAIEGTLVCASPSIGGIGRCANTDSKGEYMIVELASGEYIVEFNGEKCPPLGGECKKLYITQYYNGKSSRTEASPVTVTAGKTTEGINASLAEGGSISGKVTSAAGGGAIEGTSVCASPSKGGFGGCANTDSKGEYTLGGLASGEYIVEFNGEKCPPLGGECKKVYITQYYNGKSSRTEASPVTVTAGKTTEGINASLAEGGSISGKVTSAAGGGAIEGTSVCASPSKGGFGGCANTDSKGEYTLGGLASGEYIVEFNGEKCPPLGGECKKVYITQYYNGKSSRTEASPVTVTAGKTTEGINAALQSSNETQKEKEERELREKELREREERERSEKQQHEEEAAKKHQQEAAAKKLQEEEAAAKKHQEEAAAAKKHQEERAAPKSGVLSTKEAAGSASVTFAKVKVTLNSVVVTIKTSQAGTVTITGPGLKKTVHTVAAGTNRVTVPLTKAGKAARKRGKKIKLAVSLKTGNRTVSNSERIKL